MRNSDNARGKKDPKRGKSFDKQAGTEGKKGKRKFDARTDSKKPKKKDHAELAKDVVEKRNSFARDRSFEPKTVEVVQKPIREDLIEGKNGVTEAIKNGKTIEQIFVAKDCKSAIPVLKLAKEKGIVIKEVDRRKLDSMATTENHQGLIAQVTPYEYVTVDDIIQVARDKNEEPFIIILDEIEDPHNLGAIIRSAEVCGAHGVIIPKRRNIGITPVVYKTSVGAVEYMNVAKVTNINKTIDELKEKGVWVYGADMDGESFCYEANFKGAVALVIGNEGRGISHLTKAKCDVIVKIPMVGTVNSLNASVAGGILMYEIIKQRI